MQIQDVFALITTDNLAECRDFYTRHFGFEVAFESSIYLQLSFPGVQATASVWPSCRPAIRSASWVPSPSMARG